MVVCFRRIGAHGILADDMGLGKTLQALMAVAMCHHHNPGEQDTMYWIHVLRFGQETRKFTECFKKVDCLVGGFVVEFQLSVDRLTGAAGRLFIRPVTKLFFIFLEWLGRNGPVFQARGEHVRESHNYWAISR